MSTAKMEHPWRRSTVSECLRFRDAVVSFAIDISGSTYGATLNAEKKFIRDMSNLLSAEARFQAKVLPWDHTAHPIRSLGQLNQVEDHGGTDPGAILRSSTHLAALKQSSLWFMMTDGLIDADIRAKFASDVALHGVHGICCVVVIFGNPNTGPASCDISVGIGVFAVVPNCAFLFCNETNGDLRVMQTKGTFNVLLKGKQPPVFDSSCQWDTLPQVSVTDFADVAIPKPQTLGVNEMVLQYSLVINMDDLFANRLNPEEIGKIFNNPENLETRPDSDRAGLIFAERIDFLVRGQPPPETLQTRLRAAYLKNMKSFVSGFQQQIHMARQRLDLIGMASASSYSPIDSSTSLSSPDLTRWKSASPAPIPGYLQDLKYFASMEPPGAPGRRNAAEISAPHPYLSPQEAAWRAWEAGTTDDKAQTMPPTPNPGSTPGCPLPGNCTQLTFPLAMGHFPETASVLAQAPSASATPSLLNFSQQQKQPMVPMLVCDPCSVFCTRVGPHNFGITAALPMVRFQDNSEAICSILHTAFERRFAKVDLPQVFLSVLILAELDLLKFPTTSQAILPLNGQPNPPPQTSVDLASAAAAAKASKTFREAVEWTAHDLLHSIMSTRELSQPFSSPAAPQPSMVWPLSNVLARHFEELDTASGAEYFGHQGNILVQPPSPLLRHPPQGFVVFLRLAALINISEESRRRMAFRRFLYLLCEELEKSLKANENAQFVTSNANLQSAEEGTARGGLLSSVTVQRLRKGNLLSFENYASLYLSDEFRDLEALSWVGPAVALFLHGLYWVSATKPGVLAVATESYGAVFSVGLIGKTLSKPEDVSEDVVRKIFGVMTPPVSMGSE
ncbi:hypothetical protein QBC43DRAFT_380965 [Cladorrhinum sp. PSN259]|nr:hypothetical protein QBC43DRAFT_380965 [Cladorrhinum sp. PSN259]